MKNNKGFVVPLLIGIIALLVIGGGVYIYKNKKVEVPNSVNVEEKSTAQLNTSNWKTYTNNNYGFQIKYPINANVQEDLSAGYKNHNLYTWFLIPDERMQFGLLASPAEDYDFGCIGSEQDLAPTKPDVSLDGVTFKVFDLSRFYYPDSNTGIATKYCTVHKGNIYELTQVISDISVIEPNSVLNQILSTFKFTDTLPVVFRQPVFDQRCIAGQLWEGSSCVNTEINYRTCSNDLIWNGSACVNKNEQRSYLTILSPKVGDTLQPGQTIDIAWTPGIGVTYFVFWRNDEEYYDIPVSNNTDKSGLLKYTLPEDIVIGGYKIIAWYSPVEYKFQPPDGYPIPLGSSEVKFEVVSPHNCSRGQSWNGSICMTPYGG